MAEGEITAHDLNWLREKGFFERERIYQARDGKIIRVDEKNRLAYVEVSSIYEVEELRRETRGIRYLWFYFPENGAVKVYRNVGEVRWFCYNPEFRYRPDYLKSKMDKLTRFSPQNMTILFDIRDIVNRFYDQLWEMRLKMARSINEIKEDKNKLLVVQRFIDRLIFFYFLSQLGLVRIKNKEIDYTLDRRRTRKFFKWVCDTLDDRELQEFLNKIFFDVLGRVEIEGWSKLSFKVGKESFSVVAPSLNGGLFVEEIFESISEREIQIKHVKELIQNVLNRYNWIIGEELPEEEDVIGDLTPEVVGHIYEKFVISLEQMGIDKIRLDNIQMVKEEIRVGRKKIGAYYTPEEITNYISMNTIYPYITDRINERFGTNFRNIWRELIDKPKYTKKDLEILKYLYFEVLGKLRICDNACGSGSFLIAAGNVLLRLYSKILKILASNLPDDEDVRRVLMSAQRSPSRDYYLVRQIIINNLYGVDIIESAVEIAKLRFWLWLISRIDPRRVGGRRIETLPNLDFNLMVGNSLVGFINIKDEFDFVNKQKTLDSWLEDKMEWLKKLVKEKQKFKILPICEAVKLKEKLNQELKKAREFLNQELYNRIKLSGIKISEEEFLKLKPFHWGFEFYETFDLDKPKGRRGFDVIVGNPPHGDLLNDAEKEWMKRIHSHSKPNNIAEVFFERSLNQAKLHGRIGYVIPKTIGFYSTWSNIRSFILNNHRLEHLADVGIGFIGVVFEQLVPIVKKLSKDETSQIENCLVSIHIGEPLKTSAQGKQIKFVGAIPQSLMQSHGVFIFRPISKVEKEIIELINCKSVKFRSVYEKAFRGLYIPDKEKTKLRPGSVLWVDKVPYVSQNGYYITNVKRIRLKKKWAKKVSDIMKPRLFFKVLRGKRLVCFADIEGKFLTTEKLVNVVLPDNSKYDLRALMIILNSPIPSFYIQKMIFSETTETSRVMDDVYVGEIPIPINLPLTQKPFVILYNYMFFLHATEERRIKEKELIEFIGTQIIDPLVYELYFKEKFEKDGIKTDFLELVESYLEDISSLNSDEQKLKIVKQVVGKIKVDKKIMEQIDKIKSHPWVKTIEGEKQ